MPILSGCRLCSSSYAVPRRRRAVPMRCGLAKALPLLRPGVALHPEAPLTLAPLPGPGGPPPQEAGLLHQGPGPLLLGPGLYPQVPRGDCLCPPQGGPLPLPTTGSNALLPWRMAGCDHSLTLDCACLWPIITLMHLHLHHKSVCMQAG